MYYTNYTPGDVSYRSLDIFISCFRKSKLIQLTAAVQPLISVERELSCHLVEITFSKIDP